MAEKKLNNENEDIETLKKVSEIKLAAEANVVSILYKKPELILETNLKLEEFSNNIWKVYFAIINDIVFVEKKISVDEIVIGQYLEKHPKLKEKYYEYGEYETLRKAMEYVDIVNLKGHLTELRKWKAVLELSKRGFPVKNRLSEFADMQAEDIYNEYEGFLNHTFANIDSDVKSYNIADGIYDLIDKLNEGFAIGLPYHNMQMLSRETGGQNLGTITLLGGISNAGKSTVARSMVVPSIIKSDERVVIMINEDSFQKWQREMLVWIANNIFKEDLQKHTVRDGKYSDKVKEILLKSADWLIEKTQDHKITIIPFLQYQTAKAIKTIKKYSVMGVKYFILDTFKMDAGKVSANSWIEMQQSMVAIKDVVKAEAMNVHILITFQLEKGSSVMRHYTQNNIGVAKNIVDVASTCIMIRDVFRNEYTGQKTELKVYRLEGKEGKTKVEVKLEKEKTYQIFFIVKNQEGSANSYQIVAEHDKSRNILKEIGVTYIAPDL